MEFKKRFNQHGVDITSHREKYSENDLVLLEDVKDAMQIVTNIAVNATVEAVTESLVEMLKDTPKDELFEKVSGLVLGMTSAGNFNWKQKKGD